MIDHGMSPEPRHRRVNRYTVLMEVRLPAVGRPYALINTDKRNRNGADAWIDAKGRLGGGGYSRQRLQAGRWHQIALSVDTAADARRYFLDGRLVLTQDAGGADGRHAIRSVFLLFADNSGRDSAIDVRRVAVFPRALSESEIEDLKRSDWACPKS